MGAIEVHGRRRLVTGHHVVGFFLQRDELQSMAYVRSATWLPSLEVIPSKLTILFSVII